MVITREGLIAELAAMPPAQRGRRALERLIQRITLQELAAATGRKPRIRVKSGRSTPSTPPLCLPRM